MRVLNVLFWIVCVIGLATAANDLPKLRIGKSQGRGSNNNFSLRSNSIFLMGQWLTEGILKKADSCNRKARNGDLVGVHYTGKLEDGTVFDSSLDRGQPIEFPLGVGRVIPGWDQGILGMCVGEKRKLTIPPHLGYGSAGAGASIPPDATLIFTTELVSINGEGSDKSDL
jgi:FK506-binding protein 2